MRSDVKILLTWDAEIGLPAEKLREILYTVPGDAFVAVVKPYNDDNLMLIQADDWISESEAIAAVLEILRPSPPQLLGEQ